MCNIPEIRSVVDGEINIKNLVEALEMWSYLRGTANDLLDVTNQWKKLHDMNPSNQALENINLYERGAHTIGEKSMEVLEQVINELKTNEEVLAEHENV